MRLLRWLRKPPESERRARARLKNASLMGECISEWSLELEAPPFETPHSTVAYVTRAGVPLVLKVTRPATARRESVVLTLLAGRRLVRLIEYDGRGAVLVERARPGTPLAALLAGGRYEAATGIACEVAEALHATGLEAAGAFTSMEETPIDFTIPPHERAIERSMLAAGRRLHGELTNSQRGERLLHADLHHANVVEDAAEGWLAIDPSGLVGERELDIAALFSNPLGAPPWTVPLYALDRCTRLASERLALDRERLIGWIFAEAVRFAASAARKGKSPVPLVAVAHVARQLMSRGAMWGITMVAVYA